MREKPLRTYTIPKNRWQNFYHFDCVGSTNTEAEQFIVKGIRRGIVIADAQTEGKGRGGRTWHSPEGKNIYITFFDRCDDHELLKMLPRIVALALHKTITAHIDTSRIAVKWPNDLLADMKKLSGVLIRYVRLRDIDFYAAGIGINMEPVDKTLFTWNIEPSSLQEATGKSIETETVLTGLIANLEEAFLLSHSEITARYGALVEWMIGSVVSFLITGSEQQGIISGFSSDFSEIEITTAGVATRYPSVSIEKIRPVR